MPLPSYGLQVIDELIIVKDNTYLEVDFGCRRFDFRFQFTYDVKFDFL